MNFDPLVLVVSVSALIATLLLVRASASGFSTYRRNFTDKSRESLRESFLFVEAERVFGFLLIGAVVVPALLWFLTDSFVPALIGLVAVVALPRLAYRIMSSRRRLKIVLQLPDALNMLASAVIFNSPWLRDRPWPSGPAKVSSTCTVTAASASV